jgi:hypothetical protein
MYAVATTEPVCEPVDAVVRGPRGGWADALATGTITDIAKHQAKRFAGMT